MEGFAEVDESGRSLMDTYLSLAEASSGIVDEKYAAYADSLAAALTNVKNSFDSIVATVSGGWLADVTNGFAAFLQMLAGFAGIADGAVGKVTAIAGVLTVLGTVLKTAIIPMLGPLAPVLGVIGAGVGVAAGIGAAVNSYNAHQQYVSQEAITERSYSAMDRERARINRSYENASAIVDRWQQDGSISEEDSSALKVSLNALKDMGVIVLNTGESIDTLAANADTAAEALAGVKRSIGDRDRKRGTKDAAKAIGSLGEDVYFDTISQSEGVVGFTEEQARALFANAPTLAHRIDDGGAAKNSPEMLGTVALIKALYNTEGDIFGDADEYVTKGSRGYKIRGGYSDFLVKETKSIGEMTDDELIYALQYDAKLRDKLVSLVNNEKFNTAFD